MSIDRLRICVAEFTQLVQTERNEDALIAAGRDILGRLIAQDDWLPEFAAEADPVRYRQYLLHCDPLERFSIVSFVWGPGQTTPIHNHTVWGLVGVLRGEERARRFEPGANGRLEGREWTTMRPGDIDVVSPSHGDIHQVSNGLEDRPSISIHVYGANIGAVARNVFDPATAEAKLFVSGYSNAVVPNLWYRAS